MRAKIIIAIAGIALLAACKGRNGEYEIVNNSPQSSAADSVTVDPSQADSPKLVKTAGMSMKVKNVQQTTDSVSKLTASLSGMVMHHRENTSTTRSEDITLSEDSIMRVSALTTTADMTVKVPSEKLEDFMNKVGHMSVYVTLRNMDIEDKSLDYLSSKMKLKNRREMVAQQKSGKIKIKDPAAVLWLKDDMVDGQISNQKIDDAVAYSVVDLNFYQNNTIFKEAMPNDNPSAYRLPFFTRLGFAIANGWTIFVEAILAIANLWVLVLVGVVIWIGFKAYRKKYAGLKVS